VLNACESVVLDADTTDSFEPTDGALDNPSYLPEAASVILSAASDNRLDALYTQGFPSRLTVVSAIREENIWMAARSASPARNSREIGDRREYLPMVAGIR